MRIVKYLAICVAVVLLGGGIGGYFFLKNIDLAEYSAKIEKLAEETTGRDLKLGSQPKLVISLSPGIALENVSFSNAPWGTRKEMAKIKKLEAELSIPALLTGTIAIKRFVVEKPDIWVETNKKGVGNWVMESPDKTKESTTGEDAKTEEKDSSGSGFIPTVDVALFSIENGLVTYTDGQTGAKNVVEITSLDLHTRSGSGDKPQKLVVKMDVDGNGISVISHMAGLKVLTGNDEFAFDLNAEAFGVAAKLDGVVDEPLSGKGLNIAGHVSTRKMAGAPNVDVSFKATDPENSYLLDNIKIQLPKGVITGSVRFVPAEIPELRFRLNGKDIDVTALSAKEGQPKAANDNTKVATQIKSADDGRVIPDVELPASALNAIRPNGSIVLKNTILAEGLSIPAISVDVAGKKGRVDIKPKVEFAKGTFGGAIALADSGKSGMSLDVSLDGKKVDLSEMAKGSEAATIQSGGLLDADIRLAGKATNLRDLFAGLNGNVSTVVGKTTIHSNALGWLTGDVTSNMLNAFSADDSAKKLAMGCAVVHFDVKDGVMSTDKQIAVDADKVKIVGSGTVNLGNEKLDLSIKPSAKKGLRIGVAQALTGMTRVKGTFGSPSVGIDAGGTAKTAVTVGAALATGGLSFLGQKLIGAVAEDKDPCFTAVKGSPFEGRFKASVPEKTESKPAEKETPKSPEKALVEGLSKGLGGLFGK